MNTLTQSVIESVASYNGDELVSFDMETMNTVIKELTEYRKSVKQSVKEIADEAKEAKNAELDAIGKEFYDNLAVGDEFTYVMADGTEVLARKIETKSASGKSAACELVNAPSDAKTTKRYPKFRQVKVA